MATPSKTKSRRPKAEVKAVRQLYHLRFFGKPWRPEDDRLLRTLPDRQIAKLLNRRVDKVRGRRLRLGIPSYFSGRRWTREAMALLGAKTDEEVARLIALNSQLSTNDFQLRQ